MWIILILYLNFHFSFSTLLFLLITLNFKYYYLWNFLPLNKIVYHKLFSFYIVFYIFQKYYQCIHFPHLIDIFSLLSLKFFLK